MNNVTLNAKKFNFRSTDCPFFTPEGLKIDPKKIEAILLMEAPTNIKDLQSFLGLVKYLNRFSANLVQIAEPLQRLCMKDAVYAWESQQQEAFEAIKVVITTAPVLVYFDKDKKHYIKPNVVPQHQPEEPETTLVSAQTTPVVRPQCNAARHQRLVEEI